MLDKMSEAQRLMLQAAVAREDRILQPSAKARGAAAKAFITKLIEAGWVKEVKAPRGAPVWRSDKASSEEFALTLTPKGVKAIGPASDTSDCGEVASAPPAEKLVATKASSLRKKRVLEEPPAAASEKRTREVSLAAVRVPRADSKLGRVVEMLAGNAGATIGDLTTATGWLEHTTRAALTGLRHRGYVLTLTKREGDGASVYRIAAGEVAK
jgi:Protein of unknown function (DUF3489)